MTLAETLTRYFYLWEERGRGWHFADAPVPLEPPFTPFYPPSAIPKFTQDDGRHPTYLHYLWRTVRRNFFPEKKDLFEILALPMSKKIKDVALTVFAVSLPPSLDLGGYEAEQLLLMLSYCAHPVSFEVIGSYQKLTIQIACAEHDKEYVTSQFKTFYPACAILPCQDALLPMCQSGHDMLVTEFGLCEEFMRPLAFADSKEPSMYLGMKGIFDVLKQNEYIGLQILFQGATHPWTKSIVRSVSDGQGHSFFEDAPEMPKLAQKKVASQLFGAVVRVVASTQAQERTDNFLRHAASALIGQTKSQCNRLTALSNDGYDDVLHLQDVLARRSRRFGMLLNTEELARMVHIPQDTGIVSALASTHTKTKPLPAEVQGHEHVLGVNEHMGVAKVASVSAAQRFTHTHVIGATGTGKSTFLLNNIIQDIKNGNGIAVLDPHGDLIEAVLAHIPMHRKNDVILIDPSDNEYSVGFNILSATNELEKEVLSSDLVSMFQKFSTSWGDQMNSVLANTLLAFLENTEKGTLLDVRKFLLEPAFRQQVLKTVTDSSVVYYWQKEFPIIKGNAVGSILTRLDAFLRPKAIRYMVGQKDGIDMNEVLNSQKILLVKLSHGLIGESNSYLLGSLIVSKIYQSALSRQSIAQDARKPFYAYIDEFQHFVTPSLSHMLSGGRKYHLGLILAHQSLEQIAKADAELVSSLVANAGIRACFRLGENDAQKLAKGFASFDETDLLSLGTGQAVCRVGRSDMDFNISIPKTVTSTQDVFVPPDEVIKASYGKYGALRSDLESVVNPAVSFKGDAKEAEVVIEKPKEETPPVREEKKPEPRKEEKIETVAKESDPDSKVIHDPQLVADLVRRKEESRHRYLQMLIKRNAESRGFKAVIEQQTKDGKGRVDVVLQKGKTVIAVEIGVMTSKEWECHNIEKCLADGHANIVALSEDMRGADLMTRKLTECGIFPTNADKVKVHDMTGFMGMLDKEETTKSAKVKTVKGYRVRVEYGDKQK